MNRTKIVCTIGPSCDSEEKLRLLLKNGMNVARLNMSHGNLAYHKEIVEKVKNLRRELDMPCAIMVDTCGPEIRMGTFINKSVILKKNDKFSFVLGEIEGNEREVSLNYKEIYKKVTKSQKIFANNGLIEFCVTNVEKNRIDTKVVVGGYLSDHKSISIPHVRLNLPFLSKKDEENIKFAVENEVEYISASFVSSEKDVLEMDKFIKKLGGKQEIIAKIESEKGVENLEEIVKSCGGIMVARGDLGTEVKIEKIPLLQKKMINLAIKEGKKVIVATEMLESMTTKIRPTRAETTDVAEAIFEYTGATMLSGETASGENPIESVKTMKSIIKEAEEEINYEKGFMEVSVSSNILDALSLSAVITSKKIGAKCIVCFTDNGNTANMLSRFRGETRVLAITHNEYTFNKMALVWGVESVLKEEENSLEDLINLAKEVAKEKYKLKTNDLIVVTLGVPIEKRGQTNSVTIVRID